MIFDSVFLTFYSHELRTKAKSEAGRSFLTMQQELRQATSITSAQSTGVTFTFDSDLNGTEESIQYSWSGTAGAALQRIATVTTPLVNSVNGFTLTYYDANNNPLSFPVTVSSVRLVAFNLSVTNQNETFQLRSQVRLRNLS